MLDVDMLDFDVLAICHNPCGLELCVSSTFAGLLLYVYKWLSQLTSYMEFTLLCMQIGG